MNNSFTDPQAQSPTPPTQNIKTPEKPAATIDVVYAFLAIILGYIFVKCGLFSAMGIGITAFAVILVVASLIYAHKKSVELGIFAWGGAALIIIFSLVFVLSDNEFIKFLTLIFECIATPYWYFTMFGGKEAKTIDDMFILNMAKAVFALPVSNMGMLFTVITSGIREKRGVKRIGFILLGLFIALIPSAIVMSLLLSADIAFRNLIDYLFSDIGNIFNNNIPLLFFLIPVTLYLFGMMYANSEKKHAVTITRESNQKLLNACQTVSPLIICTAMTPLLLIYLMFFISQSAYFLSAFQSILPDGMTYAHYAREGFFQLCIVSFINAFIVSIALLLTKRSENNQKNGITRGYVAVFSLFTLALIATAISKMFLYIKTYGLTLSRVYATWFMIFIGVMFILLIFKQFIKKMNFMRFALPTFLVLFAFLTFSDLDARIAEYNIDKFMSGELETLDVDMIGYELSDSAVPYLLEAYDRLPKDMQATADKLFSSIAERKDTTDNYLYSYRSFNFPTEKASKLLSDAGYDTEDIFGFSW